MIKPTKPRQITELISTYDIETDDGQLLDLGFCHDGNYQTFSSWFSWLEYLRQNRQDENITTIWAHNGGGFDNVGLALKAYTDTAIQRLLVSPPEVKLINGSILELVLEFETGPVRFRDSMRLFPMRLDKALKSFDLDGKVSISDIDYEHMARFKNENPTRYHDYLKQDVMGLFHLLTKFRAIVNNELSCVGDLPLSLGSLALRIFKTSYLDRSIVTPGPEERQFTRRAYAGGRTEFFGNGYTRPDGAYPGCTYYDVNSMYPAAMQSGLFPVVKGLWCRKLQRDESGEILPGCYEVDYEQTGGCIPLLRPEVPDHPDCRAKDYQFSGHGVFTHFELNALERVGGTIHCIRGLVYIDQAPLFQRFVDSMYALRMRARAEKNTALDLVAKLVANNLYGKFAQREQGEKLWFGTVDDAVKMPDGKKILSIRCLYDDPLADVKPWLVTEYVPVYHAFPAIGAFITAACRVRLAETAEAYAAHILYCDTDSLIIQDAKMPASEVDPNRLGAWKVEHENVAIWIWGRKGYEIEHHGVKQKGIPKSALLPGLALAVQHGKVPMDFKRPAKIKSALRYGNSNPNRFDKYTRTVQRDKSTVEKGGLHLDKIKVS